MEGEQVSQEVRDALARAGGGGSTERKPAVKINGFEGQVLSVISFKEVSGGKYGPSTLATTINASGEEVDVWLGQVAAAQVKEIASQLPLDLKVVGFDTGYGTRGFKFELA